MSNSYQVTLSDTARLDLARLENLADASSDAAAKVTRLRSLLVGVSESAASDHVLLGGSVGLELRYRSEGSTYLYFRRDEDAKIVVVAFFCDLEVPKAGSIACSSVDAGEPRIVDLQMRDIPQGMEAETAVERTQPDGSRILVRVFTRKVDWGEHYTVLTHCATGTQRAGTIIVSGKKGDVVGEWRHDLVETTELLPDGSVRRHEPQTVPVWLGNPFYESGSTDEVRARVRKWLATIPEDRRAEVERRLGRSS